jgi:uncharacterized protein (TIGR03435 family)
MCRIACSDKHIERSRATEEWERGFFIVYLGCADETSASRSYQGSRMKGLRSAPVILLAIIATISLVFVERAHAQIVPQASPPSRPLWQTAPVPAWQGAAGGHQEFDVASVRENKSGNPWSGGAQMVMNIPYGPDDNYRVTGGILSAKNYPLINLLVFAYKVPTAQGQVLFDSLPAWANGELFDIQARTESVDVTKDQMRLMMQSLLEQRFHLVIHREMRQVKEFAAVLMNPGKLGPNIRPHPADEPCSSIYVAPKESDPPPAPRNPHAFAKGFPLRCRTFGPGPASAPYFKTEGALDLPMEAIVGMFSGLGNLGRPVVDQTGLTGTYDWYFEFLPELPPGLPAGAELPGRPADASGPSFSEGLHKQLGIKLVPFLGPYDYVVVDHIDRPTAN